MLKVRGYLLSAILCSAAVVSVGLPVKAQQPEASPFKTVETERWHTNNPARLVKLLVGNQEVTPGAPFRAADDWLKDLTLVIRNETKKTIVAAVVHFDFPETETSSKPRIGHQIHLGQLPEHALYNRQGNKVPQVSRPALAVPPGQEFSISLAPEYEDIKRFIQTRQRIDTVNVAWVRLLVFYFDDGTKWSGGNYQRPDPNAPGVYFPIRVDDFNAAH